MKKINLKINKTFSQKRNHGFTLFIAMIVTTLVLGVGFSISAIVLKQLKLASSGRESQIAFYAADSAAECALFWDRQKGTSIVGATDASDVPDSPFAIGVDPLPDEIDKIRCGTGTDGGNTGRISGLASEVNGNAKTTTFYVAFDDDSRSCARVRVTKEQSDTRIDVRGYNAPFVTDDCQLSARSIERGLKLSY
jgi:hypothetical protein